MLSDMPSYMECLKAAIEGVNLLTPVANELQEEMMSAARDVMRSGSQRNADAYCAVEAKFFAVWDERQQRVSEAIDALYGLMPGVQRMAE